MTLRFEKAASIAILFIAMVLLPMSSTADDSAHGIWGVGVQIGMLEYGSSQNADPGFLIRSLNAARELAIASRCIPTDEIDSLLVAMRATSNSRSLYPRIAEYRNRLARYVIENCDCTDQGSGGLGRQGSLFLGKWIWRANCPSGQYQDTFEIKKLAGGTFSGMLHHNSLHNVINGRIRGNKIVFERDYTYGGKSSHQVWEGDYDENKGTISDGILTDSNQTSCTWSARHAAN